VSAWQGGFQGQITVTNTGSSALNGWKLGWTFPGDQEISSLWNGNDSQSGAAVTVSNASYDGSVAPGATVTVGFTATNSGDTAPGITVSCT
jgi:cellulase/cellobiase CelA1